MHQLMPGPPFKNVINTETKDNNQFTSELLRSIVSGKLIICYNSMVDINWLRQQHMLNILGLDLTNFTKTAKFSYMACKRLMNLNMKSIPNSHVFNYILKLKGAGFSMVKEQVSISSPFTKQIQVSILSCNLFEKVIKNKSR